MKGKKPAVGGRGVNERRKQRSFKAYFKRQLSKKEKLYTALTVAEIVVGIVGIALFVVLCRTEEDFHRYIVALLLAIIMIVNGTYGLFKKPNNKKKDDGK